MSALKKPVVARRHLPLIAAAVAMGLSSCGGSGGDSADNSGAAKTCPTGYTQPADMVAANLGGWGNPLLQRQKSGQIVSIPLPAEPAGTNSGVVVIAGNVGAATPDPVTLEISVNKCAGLIDPPGTTSNPNSCSLSSQNGVYNNIAWVAKPVAPVNDTSSAATIGYCWAGDPGATYYINARWTYTTCPFGQSVCGFAIQHNPGGL